MTGIYKIESKINPNKIYIGSAIDIKKRWHIHLSNLNKHKHHSKKLQRHCDKYGKDDLVFVIIELCFPEYLIIREQYYINKLKPFFNICKIAGNTLGVKHSEKDKQKMRKPRSEQTKRNMSKSKLGNKNGFKKGQKHSNWNIWRKGKSLSKEHKQKISNSLMNNIPWNKGIKQKDYKRIINNAS